MIKGIFRAAVALWCLAAMSVFPCTIFNASKNGRVLAGNNEDLNSTDSRVWFYPPTEGKHGYVYVGFDSYGTQGGMNDQGLFFDFNALKFGPTKWPLHGFPWPELRKRRALSHGGPGPSPRRWSHSR